MAVTATREGRTDSRRIAWRGFHVGLWQKEIDVRDFIQQNYDALRRRRVVPRARDARARRSIWDTLTGAVRRGAEEGRARRLADPRARSRRTRPATSTASTRSSSACRPTRRSSARSCRTAGFRMVRRRAQDLRLRARSARGRGVHEVPQDPQRGGVRRLHRRHPALPQLAHPHRAARRLRPRPDHRRLPARRALRRQPADRAQAGGEGRARQRASRPTTIIRDREELSEQIRALKELMKMAASYGFDISGPAAHREGSRAVALLRLPRRREGAERRGDVARPHARRSSTSTSSAISPPAR